MRFSRLSSTSHWVRSRCTFAQRRLTKLYCMAVAMLATVLVGLSRIYLGVHYPTDVLAGWLIGLSWALLCWLIERSLERQAGLKREQEEATARARADDATKEW